MQQFSFCFFLPPLSFLPAIFQLEESCVECGRLGVGGEGVAVGRWGGGGGGAKRVLNILSSTQ